MNTPWVCRGIPIFHIFAPKHRLWVPTIYVLSKNKKNIKEIQLEILDLLSSKNLCLLHGEVFVMFKARSQMEYSLYLGQKFAMLVTLV